MATFIACVTIAPRSYVREPNELGATGTTSALRSFGATGREEELLGNPRENMSQCW